MPAGAIGILEDGAAPTGLRRHDFVGASGLEQRGVKAVPAAAQLDTDFPLRAFGVFQRKVGSGRTTRAVGAFSEGGRLKTVSQIGIDIERCGGMPDH